MTQLKMAWNIHFSKKYIQKVNRYMKRFSTSLIIRKTQTEFTIRYHFMSTRTAIIKKTRDNKCKPQFSSVAQSCPTLCDPMITARQASLSITNSWSSSRLTSIESVMPCSHLILGHPLLLLPPIPPTSESFPMSQLFA